MVLAERMTSGLPTALETLGELTDKTVTSASIGDMLGLSDSWQRHLRACDKDAPATAAFRYAGLRDYFTWARGQGRDQGVAGVGTSPPRCPIRRPLQASCRVGIA